MNRVIQPFLFLSLILAFPAVAQYHWQYPIPQGNRLNDMYFVEGSTIGYAVGIYGTTMKTTDNGLSWTPLDSATAVNLNGVYFTSPDKGYAVGDEGVILMYDGNNQWMPMESGTHYHLNTVAFAAPDKGYAAGYKGLILKNNGNTWEEISSPTVHALYCMEFASGTIGIAAGDSGTILRTVDGGGTWTQIESGKERAFLDVCFSSETTGYLAGQKGMVMKTTDAGATWLDITYPQLESNLLSIDFANDTAGYACGAKGVILSTINGGSSWGFHEKNTNLSYNELKYLSPPLDTIPDTIILCGDYGVILRSDSGLIRMNNVTHGSNFTISSLKFPTENMAFAVGGDPFNNKPLLMRSYDGESWSEFKIDTIKRYLTDISFIDTTLAYISATSGFVYRFQIDSAVPIFTTFMNQLYAIKAFTPDKIYAAGLNGTLIRTTMGDTLWQKMNSTTEKHLYNLFFINEDLGYAVGDQGIMLKITNGNQVQKVLTGFNIAYYDINFPTPEKGFLVGYNGRIIKVTRNNGVESFSEIPSGVTTPLNAIYFPNPDVGYISGEGGVVLKTTDGGESWLPQYTGTQNGLRTLYFADEETGWLAGAGTTILKTENGGGPVITPGIFENEAEPYSIKLYPNPTTWETWIEFELTDRSAVHLSAWDLSGRQIEVIADENRGAGIARYHYNTSGLPEGIYLLIAEINGVRRAEKLVIY